MQKEISKIMLKIVKKKVNNAILKIFLILGCILRIVYGLNAKTTISQHDVFFSQYGHFDYACYIFSKHCLPNIKKGQFYHPPLNAILQAATMKLTSLFIKPIYAIRDLFLEFSSGNVTLLYENDILKEHIINLYESTKILSIVYSLIILIIIYKILKSLKYKNCIMNFVMCIVALYPGLIYYAGSYNNDQLSYLFFFLSIYISIIWYNNPQKTTIVLLALSIGLGMLSKVSCGIVSFIVGPILFVKLVSAIRDYNDDRKGLKNIIVQLLLFTIIVFPLGLSYCIRNYILFNQPFTYVLTVTQNNPLYIDNSDSISRFLSFPFSRLIDKKYGVYHSYNEINIWLDLLKTSTFDENYFVSKNFLPSIILLILNLIFYIISIIVFLYNVIKCIFDFMEKKNCRDLSKSGYEIYFDLKCYIPIMLIILAVVSYVIFNINYPASCSSSYRYCSYITLGNAILIAIFIDDMRQNYIFIRKN